MTQELWDCKSLQRKVGFNESCLKLLIHTVNFTITYIQESTYKIWKITRLMFLCSNWQHCWVGICIMWLCNLAVLFQSMWFSLFCGCSKWFFGRTSCLFVCIKIITFYSWNFEMHLVGSNGVSNSTFQVLSFSIWDPWVLCRWIIYQIPPNCTPD